MSAPNGSVRHTVYDFLNTHRAATLATVNAAGDPDSATVYYVADKRLRLYFMTRVNSRKFRNLAAHPRVSMVVTDESQLVTVQLTGTAKRVERLREDNHIMFRLWVDNYKNPSWPPPAVRLFEKGAFAELAIVRVTPKTMTFARFKKLNNDRYQSFFQQVMP